MGIAPFGTHPLCIFGIDPELCSLHYTTVEDVAHIITDVGSGALLAKFDIESAYRLIPVHPQDRPLQAVRWEGNTYVDPMLPFGLRSAPKIFNAVADALNWHLHQAGIPLIRHYLDDYIIITPPDTSMCASFIGLVHREWNDRSVMRRHFPVLWPLGITPKRLICSGGRAEVSVNGPSRRPRDSSLRR